MSGSAALLNVLAAVVGIWAIFKLAVAGMYNYHLYRLHDLRDVERRRRFGGLFYLETTEVRPHILIESLQEGITAPYLPAHDRRNITRALAVATLCAVLGTVYGSPSQLDLVIAAGFPVLALGTSAALVGIHAAFVEVRLWRSDPEKCEDLYQMLSKSDSETYPRSF